MANGVYAHDDQQLGEREVSAHSATPSDKKMSGVPRRTPGQLTQIP
jgi:hypothetical protein